MRELGALVRLSSRRLAELLGMRSARAYAIGLGLSFAALVLLTAPSAQTSTLDALLTQALKSASWLVGGLSALSAARDLAERDRRDGIAVLAGGRGHDDRALELARALAASLRIAVAVALPVVGLVWLSCASAGRSGPVAWAIAWTCFAALYSASLGLTLGVLARGAALLSHRHGRLVLLGVVVVPELLRQSWPALPTLAAAFGWALERGAELGKVLA